MNISKHIATVIIWFALVVLYVVFLDQYWPYLVGWIEVKEENKGVAAVASYVVASGMTARYISDWLLRKYLRSSRGGNS